MTAERYQQVKAIFHQVLDTPPAAREDVLSRHCSGDAELESEIRRMLAEVDSPGALDLPAVDRAELETFLDRIHAPFPPGTLLAGRFRVTRALGSGGMGQVWEALDEELREPVAVKTILPQIAADPRIVERFKREVLNARRVTHRNVCRVYDFFVHAGPEGAVPFLTMQLLRGETLSELLGRQRPSPSVAGCILRDCAAGLTAAHQEGLIHGDFKPGNVMLVHGENHGLRAVVTDFGLARYVAEAAGHTASSVAPAGTPAYMAPEQMQGMPLTPAADVYALGVVVCETVTGLRPADGGLERLPAGWRRPVRKALDPNPARRGQAAVIFHPPWWRTIPAAAAALIVLVLAVVFWNRISGGPQTIAVLPFGQESAAHADQYFGEGLSDEIIAGLSHVPALSVIARNSSFRFPEGNGDLKNIAHALHARYLITGLVRFVDQRVQVVAQLIDPRNNRVLWSQTFQRDRSQTAALHAEIVRGVTVRLGIRTAGVQFAAFGLQVPPDNAADLYMRGRTLWASRSPQNLRDALELFSQSITIDPTFAAAYAARADTLAIMAERSYLAAATAVPQAKEAALRALILDPQLAEAHAALGLVQSIGEWDFYNAEKSLQRAVQLSPSYVYSHQWYAAVLLKTGKPGDAIREAETAAQLDPLSPAARANVGWMNYYSRQFDGALRVADDLEKDYPKYPDVCMLRSDTMIAQQAFAEALRALAACAPEIKGTPLYLRSLAIIQGLSGDSAGAADTLNSLLAMSGRSPVSEYNLAAVYANLNRPDEAFHWLNQGINHHDSLTSMLGISPLFAPVRTDSRYAETLARIGLPYKK
jgi:serine/threonine protein kinase/tetratricopeptide (TPR) repeat protein